MDHKLDTEPAQTTIQRIMDSETAASRTGKGVTLSIIGALVLVLMCGGGIF